jgi:VanZ family protein
MHQQAAASSRSGLVGWLLAGMLAAALFVPGPGAGAPRSLSHAWDLGHIVAFVVWTAVWLRAGAAGRMPARRRWIVTLAVCAGLAVLTEAAQWLTGRDASAGDALRDVLGGLLALSWCDPAAGSTAPALRRAVRGVSAALLLAALAPASAALADEWLARQTFPLLAGFETPFEAGRWQGEARFGIDRSRAAHGTASLRVELLPAEYSGVSLVHAPRDWRGFKTLRFEAFNPLEEPLDLVCRIHDGEHERRGPDYRNRFNTGLRLAPGWNAIAIDINAVARAPEARLMDMRDIRSFMVFAMRLPAPRTIFLDHVRLE